MCIRDRVLDFPSFIDYQQWREMYEFPYSMSAMEVKQSLQFEGHDGVIARVENESPEEIVAFDPNQIKSADPITRDDAGNIIPLSERFQPSSDDIRYMPAGEGRAPRRMGSATSRPARTRIPMGAVAKQLRMERDLKELKRN